MMVKMMVRIMFKMMVKMMVRMINNDDDDKSLEDHHFPRGRRRGPALPRAAPAPGSADESVQGAAAGSRASDLV